jgi:hypothetical protein
MEFSMEVQAILFGLCQSLARTPKSESLSSLRIHHEKGFHFNKEVHFFINTYLSLDSHFPVYLV